MSKVGFWCLTHVSDAELEAGLGQLLGAGARVEARIVAHLAEVEARRLDLLAGASSLYDYCKTRLALSDYEAFVRIAVARVARRYPSVFEMLERRELHLTAVCEVREFLTNENHEQLLIEVSHKTKLQIREVLARRFPQADMPSEIRKLPNAAGRALLPLSPGRYRLQLAISRGAKEKLELARDLMSHTNSSGDLAVVIERALDLLIAQKQQRRFGQTRRGDHGHRAEKAPAPSSAGTPPAEPPHEMQPPQPPHEMQPAQQLQPPREMQPPHEMQPARQVQPPHEKQPPHEMQPPREAGRPFQNRRRRHIPDEVRRQVVERDGNRCAFVGGSGCRCEGRAFLQLHHRQAWAQGGPDTADNLELLCHRHNRLLAEREFGPDVVAARQAERARRLG